MNTKPENYIQKLQDYAQKFDKFVDLYIHASLDKDAGQELNTEQVMYLKTKIGSAVQMKINKILIDIFGEKGVKELLSIFIENKDQKEILENMKDFSAKYEDKISEKSIFDIKQAYLSTMQKILRVHQEKNFKKFDQAPMLEIIAGF